MKYNEKYDKANPKSIETYAQGLIGKTFSNVIEEDESEAFFIKESKFEYATQHENKKRKGGLGEILEECYFHYKCNNDSEPDFPEAGVELKVTPYRINQNGSYSAKERLIITMIDYMNVVNEDFYNSHLWNKSKIILIVYYLYLKEIENRLDYQVNYTKLFSPPEADLIIIENDFKTIVAKIKAGKAHELSESDTLYLGAAPKAATSEDRRQQPFSEVDAKPRAFAFKNGYMTQILNNYIVSQVHKSEYEYIIKSPKDLKGISFEEYIKHKINSFIGMSDKELCNKFQREYNNNKAQWVDLSYRMLGIKSNKAEEFVKANIVVKAIRVEEDNRMIESMSFPPFRFKELAEETWEDSNIYNYFSETKFLFVLFNRVGKEYKLRGCKLWNMPYTDLNETVKSGWLNIQKVILTGVYFQSKKTKEGSVIENNLPKKKGNAIIHIRPHAKKSAYLFKDGKVIGDIKTNANELPDGQWMTTQSFWINNTYIINQITI